MLFSLSKSVAGRWLDVSEWALVICGIVLVIGLLGEHWGIKSPKWKAREPLFSLLVILGVAGELLGDGGIFLFTGQLQIIADQEVSAATKQAGDAIERAGRAEQRAAVAGKEADRARASAAQAVEAAEKAKLERIAAEVLVEESRSNNFALQGKLLPLQLELSKLESKLGARTVSKENLETIVRMTGPGLKINIVSMHFGEPEAFATDLAKAFSAGGAVVSLGGQGNMIENGSVGLHVRYDHNDPRYVSVFKALELCGWHPVDRGAMPQGMLIQVHVRPS